MILPIEMAENSYDIVLERGALDNIESYLDLQRKVMIVTDTGVPKGFAALVQKKSKECFLTKLEKGEQSKNIDNFKLILENMLNAAFSRKDCVIAIGGGVVGDIAAFAASCYMRGIDFYNIPTTLLSQVDSSIGGKTAIDFCGVKNIVGSFYQPKKVIIDFNTLNTLPKRELSAGMAEVIKMEMTSDSALIEKIKSCHNVEKELPSIIEGALRIKKDVVEKDPKEAGLRKVLNFGHTIGHAIEALFEGQFLHGECVALGCLCMCSKEVRAELVNIFGMFGLPIGMHIDADKLLPFILHDKKMNADGTVTVVYVKSVGSFEFVQAGEAELREYLKVLS